MSGTMTTLNVPATLVDLLRHATERHRKPDALRYKAEREWRDISSEQLMTRVRHTALGLDGLGVAPGDRVAMLAESSPLWTIADFGILATGAINVRTAITSSCV